MLGNALLDHAIKHNQKHSKVIKFLLANGVTTINAIGQEGRYYVSKLKRQIYKVSCTYYTDN
ncbi:hypothetical protein CCY16_00479 [Wolbachia endosymbiont of Wuchereria bancrofti]|nr:hypothetical protein CCY16_00479 [Wolbachia endosymbiont of Wuchereria bancrofti]